MQHNHQLSRLEIAGAMIGGAIAFVVWWGFVIFVFAVTGPNT